MRQFLRPVFMSSVAACLAFVSPAFADEQPEPNLAADARLAPDNPPVIPHAVMPEQDGEACNTCHRTGLKKAPPTSHPERLNCTQCHVQGEVKKEKKAGRKGKKK